MVLSRLENFLKDNNVFLSGSAGVGKSFLTMDVIRAFKEQGKSVVVLGSTALSAFNIGGVLYIVFLLLKDVKTMMNYIMRIENKKIN